jgi:hypothetical protein
MELKLLLKELAKHGIPEDEVLKLYKPPISKFKAIVRYNKGFGPQFINLENIEAENLTMAKEIAYKETESLFKSKEGFRTATIIEIKVRPIKE